MHGDREVRRRAAEHVGEDDDAVAGVDALDRLDDVLAALLDVVVGADGDGLDLLLRADDMLQRGAELDGEPPVGDEDKTDHRKSRRARLCAPHERAAMIIIRSPSARAFPPIDLGIAVQPRIGKRHRDQDVDAACVRSAASSTAAQASGARADRRTRGRVTPCDRRRLLASASGRRSASAAAEVDDQPTTASGS